MAYRKLTSAARSGSRLDQLKILARTLARSIDQIAANPDEIKQLAPLAKQYRETISEIEAIEGANVSDNEISEILQKRRSDGKPGAIRKNRSPLRN